jgi:hypothetical protein
VKLLRILALICLVPAALSAQASLRGRVLTDSTELPIAGVVVSIEELRIQAMSDSLGNFVLSNVKPGAHIITAKKIGFAALTTRLRFGANEKLEADFLMQVNAQALPEAKVEAKAPVRAKLVDFEERRALGAGGRYLTTADFDKRAWSSTSDVLRTSVPGLEIKRDATRGSQAYAVGGRLQVPGGAFTNGGNPPGPCFAAVVVDGAFVYQGHAGEPLFDINSIPPSAIAGLEYYASAASIPAKYNGTRGTCGLMMIWTR